MVYPTMSDGNVYPIGLPGQIPNKSAAKQAFYLPPAFDLDASTWVKKPWNKTDVARRRLLSRQYWSFFLRSRERQQPGLSPTKIRSLSTLTASKRRKQRLFAVAAADDLRG